MASSTYNPPPLDESSYDNWEKSIQLWQLITSLKPEKQGPAVVLALKGKAYEAALELEVSEIGSADGVKKILEKLAKIYKKDTVDQAYEAFEKFIYFQRSSSMSIIDFITEFEARLTKAKQHGCVLSDSIQGFFLLNQAQLSPDHKKLVRATITKLDLDEVKTKLSKVFGGSESGATALESACVKMEDLNIAQDEDHDTLYGRSYYSYRSRGGNFRPGNYQRGGNFRGPNSRGNARQSYDYGHQASWNSRRQTNFSASDKSRRFKCNYCQSIFHPTHECPEKIYFNQDGEVEENHDIILYQSNLLTPQSFNVFVAQASNAAILDCGASATVAGKDWFQSYVDGLSEIDQMKIEYMDSFKSFKFGSGDKFQSLFKAKIPAQIGSNNIFIQTDVVDTQIPLLLSKQAMKLAETEIDFVNDRVKMLGEEQKVHVTQSGHYALPLNSSRIILQDLNKQKVSFTLVAEESMDKVTLARKLHSQFAHPSKSKLLNLISRAGRGDDAELREAVDHVYNTCKICLEFSKPSPRPVVGLPHASTFNETVALDLKFYEGKIILHCIDHLTRFSTAIVVKNKEPREIISGLLRCWVSIFGPPEKVLTDNGGEFSNLVFLELAEAMNIRVLTTAAHSPWSNGIVERHNAVLGNMLNKVLAERQIGLEAALAWCIQAKNALANVHGFSPVQLTLGYTPKLPDVLSNSPPAMEQPTSHLIQSTLDTIKSAREAYIKAESSERLKRALNHNIRPSSNFKFSTGDIVYYKRPDSKKWKGPGKVIGRDSSCVLIKHGSNYVRVHTCRVLLDKNKYDLTNDGEKPNTVNSFEKQNYTPESQDQDFQDSTSEESSAESLNEDDPGNPIVEENERNPSIDETSEVYDDAAEMLENSLVNRRVKDKPIISLKKGLEISYETKDGEAKRGVVWQRTGKATGKYRDYWSVIEEDTGETKEYDTVNDWKGWNAVDTYDKINQKVNHDAEILLTNEQDEGNLREAVSVAKQAELSKWIEEEVFEEIKDVGQDTLSTTWVITQKLSDGKVNVKSRLVVRGYEEEEKCRTDSPTCCKDSIRLLLGLAVAKDWLVQSLDVKAAFLQGKKIERELFVTPPKEFKKANIIWKLNKVVYGLCDASRNWYLRVWQVLTNLGMMPLKCDKAVFVWRTSEIEGAILMHVDDMLYFGSQKFLHSVIEPFKSNFKISRLDSKAFKYVGINISQMEDHVTLDQRDYLNSLKTQLLDEALMTDKTRHASHAEKKIFRHGIGQLGWIAGMTRPQGSFSFCVLSTRQSDPLISDFVKYTKAIRDLKSDDSWMKIPKLDLKSLFITVYSDASFGNLSQGASQMGYIIFLHDKIGKSVPLSWVSKKIKRVARSTLTAETLAAVEAVDAAVGLKQAVEEVMCCSLPPIKLIIDNKSLHDASNTTNVLADKRLMVDISALREMIDRNEVIIQWTESEHQLADVLTKLGANYKKLSGVLSHGQLA